MKQVLKVLIAFFIFSQSFVTSAQNYSLIYFKDKNNSPFSVESPEVFLSAESIQRRDKQNIPVTLKDLPVNPHYLDSIRVAGATVKYASRWFNAALVEGDSATFDSIKKYSFVKEAEELENGRAGKENTLSYKSVNSSFYGTALKQTAILEVEKMHENGYRGDGITIAVIDAGFENVNNIPAFDKIKNSERILATYDFVDAEVDVFDDHDHGTTVLSVMAGYVPNQFVGISENSNFLLLRSEEASSEKLIEEVYWLVAAEYADSAGADIINSSLGYNTFDNPEQDHLYAEFDGRSTIITRAAEAAFETGMVVVNSAGNEGTSDWKKIVAPADGINVLAVGGVNSSGKHQPFSSSGPAADGRIKPDVAAMGATVAVIDGSGSIAYSNGTSFAAPAIAGFAANLWQQFHEYTNKEILELIRRSGNQYGNPDNLTGYGIPTYTKAIIAAGIEEDEGSSRFIYPNPVKNVLVVSDLKKPFEVVIIDVTGKEVKNYQVSEEGSIDVSDLLPGCYYLILTSLEIRLEEIFFKE